MCSGTRWSGELLGLCSDCLSRVYACQTAHYLRENCDALVRGGSHHLSRRRVINYFLLCFDHDLVLLECLAGNTHENVSQGGIAMFAMRAPREKVTRGPRG